MDRKLILTGEIDRGHYIPGIFRVHNRPGRPHEDTAIRGKHIPVQLAIGHFTVQFPLKLGCQTQILILGYGCVSEIRKMNIDGLVKN